MNKEKKDQLKKRIYEIIEAGHEGDSASKVYDIMIMVSIIGGFTPLMLKNFTVYTKTLDLLVIFVFLIDYILRIYTSDYKMGIKSYKAYLYYATTPMAIVDLLSIVPILSFIIPGNTALIDAFRLFKVLRILKVTRYSSTMVAVTNVIKRVKNELGAVLLFTLLYIYTSALIIFQVEPESFNSFFDAIYWATISITTIGYGDISPTTALGRLVTMLSALVGVAIIALPTGIITAAYMDEIKRRKNKGKLVL
ncbi:MAG: ion transporter [Butyrivibrio sp.]|nr:ion transporter [Butyrivibrio sp.]